MSDPEATYVLKLSGNFRAVSGSYTKSFIFYPKQNNYTCFEVTVVNPTRALIDIFGKKPSSTGKDIEERIISFPIELTGTPVVRAQVHIDVQVFSGNENNMQITFFMFDTNIHFFYKKNLSNTFQ